MATRKEAKRKSLLQVLTLLVIAAVVVAVVVLAQSWLRNQPDPEPEDTAIEVSVGEQTKEVYPYMIAEPGVEPAENEVPTIEVADEDNVLISLPEHVYDHDWTAVIIYDEPGANDQILHGPYEAEEITVPVTAEPVEEDGETPRLMVVEIQSAMIGTNDAGEQTPYTTVWSVATQHA